MKKLYFLYAAVAISMAACSGNKSESTATVEEIETDTAQEAVYSGLLPAADTEGIRYTLQLNYDGQANTGGNYNLTQVYISDTNPVKDETNGRFNVLTGTPQSASQSYMKLVSEGVAGAPADTLYFLVTSDTTLTLVGPDLTPAVSGLNYTITKVK